MPDPSPDDLAEAERACRHAAETYGNGPLKTVLANYDRLQRIERAAARVDEAWAIWRDSTTVHPDLADALYNLAAELNGETT